MAQRADLADGDGVKKDARSAGGLLWQRRDAPESLGPARSPLARPPRGSDEREGDVEEIEEVHSSVGWGGGVRKGRTGRERRVMRA